VQLTSYDLFLVRATSRPVEAGPAPTRAPAFKSQALVIDDWRDVSRAQRTCRERKGLGHRPVSSPAHRPRR